MSAWIPFFLSLGITLAMIPLARRYSFRYGHIALPRSDRWHKKPTPKLGGAAIFIGFIGGLAAAGLIYSLLAESLNLTVDFSGLSSSFEQWGFLIGSVIVFFLGLVDDFKPLTPPVKLFGQLVAATIVISLGFTTQFFSPRIENAQAAQLANIFLTYLWLIGITNAFNLLDNMDGLAGGIGLIIALFLGFLFWRSGNTSLFLVSLALSGSLLGFLLFNFPPAKIFMGDSGSMLLGFTLASLAIARQPQASNVFAILVVPTMLFLLPILDTAFVAITRIMRGESPVQGGRDHTSHRLIAFGFNERQAVVGLYWVAALAGVAAVAIESIGYWLSLIFVPLLVVSLTLAAAYLGMLKVTPQTESSIPNEPPVNISTKEKLIRLLVSSADFSVKRGLFEVILDFMIINLALYLAFVFEFGLQLSESEMEAFLRAMPAALVGTYAAFYYFGVYRGTWRYVGVEDYIRFAKATAGGLILTGAGVYLIVAVGGRFSGLIFQEAYPIGLFILFAFFLFLGLALSRSSFMIFDVILGRPSQTQDKKVLIFGSGDGCEMALRWIRMNPQLGLRPIGIIDIDPLRQGRYIHGVEILGGLEQLEQIFNYEPVKGVIVTESGAGQMAQYSSKPIAGARSVDDESTLKLLSICQQHGCWVRRLRLELSLME